MNVTSLDYAIISKTDTLYVCKLTVDAVKKSGMVVQVQSADFVFSLE